MSALISKHVACALIMAEGGGDSGEIVPTLQAPGYTVSSSFASRSSVRLRNVNIGAVKISYLGKLISELSEGRGSFVRGRKIF